MKKKIEKKDIWILMILSLIFISVRVILLLGSHSHLTGDDSYVAILAKHIYEGGERPFFGYNEHYNGGLAIEAYLAAILFKIFGVSAVVFRLSGLLISFALLITAYFFLKKYFSRKIAFVSGLLYSVPPSFFASWNMYVVGYMATLLIHIVLLWFMFEFIYDEKKRTAKQMIILGLLSALGYYILEYVIVILSVFFIFWFAENKKFLATKNFLAYIASFIIGIIPVIIYNLKTNFANIKHLLAGTFIHRIVCKFGLLPSELPFGDKMVSHCKIFTEFKKGVDIKGFFSSSFPSLFSHTFYGFLFSLFFIIVLVFMLYTYRESIKKLFIAFFPKKSVKIRALDKEAFFLIYIMIFIALYFLSGYTNAHHLFPIYPFLIFIIGIFFVKFIAKKSKLAFLIIISVVITGNLIDNISLANYDPAVGDEGDYKQIISFLNQINAKHVYAAYFEKWRIMFESNEKIIASCQDLCPCGYRYPAYEKEVNDSSDFVYVLNKGSRIENSLREYLQKNLIRHDKKEINNKVIFYSLSKKIRPNEFLKSCSYSDGLAPE
jgi:4-amino-4-deoxy-L-arabinose transferase-like glycosyltransferase